MMHPKFRRVDRIALLAGTAILAAALSGCVAEPPRRPAAYQGRPGQLPVQAAMSFQDDYDYYPGYETYYSRNRREYVYREGNAWVRRSEPRGVSAAVLVASPVVRVDFRDSPERHHDTVVRSYPRNWGQPEPVREIRVVRREEPRYYDPRNDPRADPRSRQVVVVEQDEYDYYPGYEVYYSRSRREYVYREGNTWVRRPQPQGVHLNVLVASPSVHLAVQGAPEQHHGVVAKKYPKNWKRSDRDDDKDDRRDDKRDRRDDDRRE